MYDLEDAPPLWKAIFALELSCSWHPDAPLEADSPWKPNATQRKEIIANIAEARKTVETLWNEKRNQALKFPQNTYLLVLADKVDKQFKAWFLGLDRMLAICNYDYPNILPWVSGDEPGGPRPPDEMDVRHFEEHLAQAVEQQNPVVAPTKVTGTSKPRKQKRPRKRAKREMPTQEMVNAHTAYKQSKLTLRQIAKDRKKSPETIRQWVKRVEEWEKPRSVRPQYVDPAVLERGARTDH